MGRLLILVLLLLSFPASAVAALEETPPVKVGGTRSECVQPLGSAEVLTATRTGPRLFSATREGLKPALTPVFRGPDIAECPSAATAASGAGVIVCCQYGYQPAAAVREPGGAWSTPVRIADDDEGPANALATAVSERGDAIVLFTRDRGRGLRLWAVRRLPGATFGAPEVVAGPFRFRQHDPTKPVLESFQAAMTADGETIVLYELHEGKHAEPRRNIVDLMVVTAPAGGRFGAPQKLASMPRLSRASLAVAPSGHAIVSLTDKTSIRVAERAPGQGFGAPVRVAALTDPVGARTRVALDAAGRAAIAWSGVAFGGVTAVTRASSGAFARPVALAPAVRRLSVDVALLMDGGLSYDIPAGGWYFGGADIHTGLDAGSAWVSWESPQTTGGFRSFAAALATLPFDGSPGTTQTVGGQTADAREVTRVTLTDGARALMWLDDQARLRLAAEGAATAVTPLPDVQVGRPLKTRLTSAGKLHLPIRCSGPCEVRGQVVGHPDADASLTLDRRGNGTLVIEPATDYFAPRRPGPVRVKLVYGAPGSTRVATRTLDLRLSQPRARPRSEPRVRNLRAVRNGNRIDVSWTTDAPAMPFFDVYGTKTRSRLELPVAQTSMADDTLLRRFTATLPAAGVRYVKLLAWTTRSGLLVVPVR